MSIPVVTEPTDAIVFVGGSKDLDQTTPAQLADSLARALDLRDPDQQARFRVRPVTLDGGPLVHRIERSDSQGTTALADLYHVVPSDGEKPRPAGVKQVASLVSQVLAGILVLRRAVWGSNRHAKSAVQKAQLWYCYFVLACLVVYLGIAVVALLNALSGAGNELEWPQWTVLVGTVLGVLVPNVRTRLVATAEAHRLMMRYLWAASRRSVITTKIRELVDDIKRRANIKNVHLVGYSFGSLVVLDTVFPTNATTTPLRQVRTIATVGCPFDLVRMLIPTYPTRRRKGTDGEPHWVNVYTPTDLLASNFADSNDGTTQATTGMIMTEPPPRTPDENIAWNPGDGVGVLSALMLGGISVHGEYWTTGATPFEAVVPRLFNEVGQPG